MSKTSMPAVLTDARHEGKPQQIVVDDSQEMGDAALLAADLALSKRISEKLLEHYPGHAWAVNANHRQGVFWIKNLSLSEEFGIRMKISALDGDANLHKIVMIGGELLERWRIMRGRYRHADMIDQNPRLNDALLRMQLRQGRGL